jgi:hypothetical protein
MFKELKKKKNPHQWFQAQCRIVNQNKDSPNHNLTF